MNTLEENSEEIEFESSPFVVLNVDEVSHHMAARLTTTLLGHLLYMKGQVPFPVNSLGHMSGQRYSGDVPQRDGKLARKRKEFLDAHDDLRSHLETTFVALSTAYAHNPAFLSSTNKDSISSGENDLPHSQFPVYRSAKIHLFLVMGSSLTLPKTRVLLELNNFHVEKFGEREYIIRQVSKASSDNDEDSEDGENGISGKQAEWEDGSDDEGEAETEAVGSASDTEEVESSHFFSIPSTPRRTASFYTASASPASEPPDTPSSRASESSEELEQRSSPETSLSEDQISTTHGCDHHHDPNSIEDESLRDCERAFSKALLKFGEVLGFENELAPTQTHILIHAPRRFSHPTWVPRQNLTQSLNKIMAPLLTSKKAMATKNNGDNRYKAKKSSTSGTLGSNAPTVGIRVVCQSASRSEQNTDEKDDGKDDVDGNDVEEMDELIWWSWDGKLVGFSD